MRILQLTPRLPFPPIDGGRVVMLQIARALARHGCDVHVLSLNPRKQRGDVEAARRALAPIPLDAVDLDTSAHAAAALHALCHGLPHLVARFLSDAFREQLQATLRAHAFDLVQIESPFLLPYVPAIREASRARVVLRALNVEFRIWEQMASHARNPIRRAALRAIARSLRRYEIAQLDTCDALVPITEDDARDFRTLGATRPMHVLPGGIDLGPYTPLPRNDSVGFLGSLDYRPNQEAVRWIADELRPRLPSARIRIGGSNAPASLAARIRIEDVPDAAAFIESMQVMIAPLFSGGGMRVKILEAMALARPVVATSVGAAGLDAQPGRDLLLADDADSFAHAIESLLRDPRAAETLGRAGRALVERRYDVDTLAKELLTFYRGL